jgi:hydrogenase maturation protease HycI
MSPSSWKKWLETTLESAVVPQTRAYNFALLGIGNEFNGDDAAGVHIARRLAARIPNPVPPGNILVIDAGLAPENFTGVLRRMRPALVLLIDAAEMGESAGTVRALDWRDSSGFGPSTHLQPLATLGEYLEAELGCRVALLGIQPAQLDFDAPLSPDVERAVDEVAGEIFSLLFHKSK